MTSGKAEVKSGNTLSSHTVPRPAGQRGPSVGREAMGEWRAGGRPARGAVPDAACVPAGPRGRCGASPLARAEALPFSCLPGALGEGLPLGAGRATCYLPLGVLDGLNDHFRGWQDLGRVSGSGWGTGLPSCHCSGPGWDWLSSPHFVPPREGSAAQARRPHALLLIRGWMVIRGVSWGQGSAAEGSRPGRRGLRSRQGVKGRGSRGASLILVYPVSWGRSSRVGGWGCSLPRGLQRAQQKPAGARAMIFDKGRLKADSGALWKREGRGLWLRKQPCFLHLRGFFPRAFCRHP